MSQFKVGDVVQRVKLPHYVGVVVKLPEMWGDDKKQSYIVAPIGKKCNDTFFAEDLKSYLYTLPTRSCAPIHSPGDLITLSLSDCYGHFGDDTFYIGPREDIRIIDGCWFYPYINWEDRQTYYGSYEWGDRVKKVVKPKLKIGDFVRLAGKASSPVVKVTYDRPYKTHIYTLENELFVSETRLAEFVFDEKDKSWSHKDVKPVAKAIEKPESADDLKVGDVVLDRRVDCSRQLGVVIRAEHPRYTVNWLDQDCVEKLVYRGSLQLHPYLPTPNNIAYRRPNSVLVVQTGTGKEFYQIGTSEAKIIEGTWYFPYVNLHTTELRYGNFHYKRPGEVLTPKFKLGDLIAWYKLCKPSSVVNITFNTTDREFVYELEGHLIPESALRLFVQAPDKVWRCELDLPPNSESKPYKAAYDIGYGDSAANLLELQSEKIKIDNEDSILGKSYLLQKGKTVDSIEEKSPPLSSDPTITMTVNGEEKVFEPAFKDVWGDCETAKPSPTEPSDAFLNVYAQIKKDFVENPDKYGPRIVLDPKAYREAQTKYPTPSIISDIVINKIDLPEPSPSVKMCAKQVEEWRKRWPAVEDYDNPYVACIEYANNHITKTLLETRKAHESVLNCYGMPIKDILAPNSVKDTEPTGVKMNLSPVNARVIRLQSVQLLNSLSKELFTKSFSESTVANEPNKFKILGNIVDHKVPPALALSLAGFSCKYGLAKAPASVKPILEVLQKEFTDESQAMLTHAKWQVVKLVATDIISSFVSLVQEHLENDI